VIMPRWRRSPARAGKAGGDTSGFGFAMPNKRSGPATAVGWACLARTGCDAQKRPLPVRAKATV